MKKRTNKYINYLISENMLNWEVRWLGLQFLVTWRLPPNRRTYRLQDKEKQEAICLRSTRRHKPRDQAHHSVRRENPKSKKLAKLWNAKCFAVRLKCSCTSESESGALLWNWNINISWRQSIPLPLPHYISSSILHNLLLCRSVLALQQCIRNIELEFCVNLITSHILVSYSQK
jgi:hypothetical protein